MFWNVLTDILILLAGALVLGAVFEHFRQSAILGYLLAGLLLGPRALGWVHGDDFVNDIAELGVSLLLFVIGLEFSLKRLLRIGAVGLGGGALQVVVTCALGAGVARALGVAWPMVRIGGDSSSARPSRGIQVGPGPDSDRPKPTLAPPAL